MEIHKFDMLWISILSVKYTTMFKLNTQIQRLFARARQLTSNQRRRTSREFECSSQHAIWVVNKWYTHPETNIAPENGWLEDYFPFGKAYFQVRFVSFREGTHLKCNIDTQNDSIVERRYIFQSIMFGIHSLKFGGVDIMWTPSLNWN